MGKLIYGFTVSVDGYIADAQGSIDWSEPSDELHQYWNDATPLVVDFARAWRAMPKVVFSRTLESVDWNSPFFPTLPSWISLRLLENRTFPGGTVLLRYAAKHD